MIPTVAVGVLVDFIGARIEGLAISEVREQFRHAQAQFGEDWIAAAQVCGVGHEEASDNHGGAAESK
eukprot:3813554-Pleurochrysis_carterae.AAC.1